MLYLLCCWFWRTIAVDREIRAIHSTKIATGAFLCSYQVRWVVSLGIESGTQLQTISGTKGDAKAAALAAIEIDDNGAS
jgi:hypothetical protein